MNFLKKTYSNLDTKIDETLRKTMKICVEKYRSFIIPYATQKSDLISAHKILIATDMCESWLLILNNSFHGIIFYWLQLFVNLYVNYLNVNKIEPYLFG